MSWIFKQLFYQRYSFLERKIFKDLTVNTDKALAVLDLGSGDGQFAFYANKKAKNCRIFCEDIAPQNLEFISLYAQHNQVENLRCLNSENDKLSLKFDRIWIFSMLHYVENEIDFLKIARDRLNIHGKILLYSPINHIKRGWLYMILFHSLNHYESMNQRKKVYNFNQLIELFDIVGLEMQKHEFICSKYGIRSQEWLSNTMMFLGSKNFGMKFFGLCYFMIASLPILIWKWIDRFSNKNERNSNAVYFELINKSNSIN